MCHDKIVMISHLNKAVVLSVSWSFSQFKDRETQCEPNNLSLVKYFTRLSRLKMILFDIQGTFTFQ